MDRRPPPELFAEDNAWLEEVFNNQPDDVDFNLGNDDPNLEPEDPRAVDVLAAKRARELARDPNYVPSAEV